MYDFNAAVKPVSLRDINSQYLEEQTRRQELANARQQNQEGSIKLSQLGQQQKDAQALRDAYAKASQAGVSTQVQQPGLTLGGQTAPGGTTTVNGPGLDRNIMLSELGKTAPHLVPQVQETFAAQDQAQLKQQQEAQRISMEQQQQKLALASQHIQRFASIFSQVKDPQSYAAAVQQAQQEGIPENFPPQYDPNWVQAHVQGAVPIVTQIDNKRKDLEFQQKKEQEAADLLIKKQNANTASAGQQATAQHYKNQDEQAATNANEKKITAVQNRAALADNVESNLKTIEDVMKNRPELFGRVSGNLSNAALAIGSNDPDKLRYNEAVENLAKANAGMHNMRSKYSMDGDIKNLNFKNGVDGLKGTVQSIRDSATQFKTEGGGAEAQHAAGAKANLPDGQTGTGSDGKKYIVKGGVWVPQ